MIIGTTTSVLPGKTSSKPSKFKSSLRAQPKDFSVIREFSFEPIYEAQDSDGEI